MAECSLSGNSVPSIGDSPHQPQSFAFPNRQFGQKFVVSRSFQANWFKSWNYLMRYVHLILVMPATNAVSERSFSTLRRIKTSTMSQQRLNNLMLLAVHQSLTDKLDLIQVANEFVEQSEHRLAIFGKFQKSDF